MNRKKIFLNVSYLFVGNVLARLLSALATILVARYLGAEDYGLLGVGLSFAAICSYFTDLGFINTLIREATKPKANIKVLISSFFRIRILLAGFITILSSIVIHLIYTDQYYRYVLYWLVLTTVWGTALQGVGIVYFQIKQQMQYVALINLVTSVVMAGTLFLGTILKWPLHYLAPVYGFSNIIGGAVSLLMVILRLGWFRGWNPSIFNGIMSFTIGGVISMVLPQLGPLLLERVTDLKQVGYFVAALRIPNGLYFIPGTIASAFYPALFEYGNQQKTEHYDLVKLELKIMSALGMAIALPFILYPEWWIGVLFGKEWLEAALVFQLLSIILVFQSLYYPLADALTTSGLQKYRTLVLLITFVISTLLYLIIGAQWGAFGGALVAVFSESILLIGFATFVTSGWKMLFFGTWPNSIVFFFIILFSSFFKTNLYPVLMMLLMGFLYGVFVILLDRSLRSYLMKLLFRISDTRGG